MGWHGSLWYTCFHARNHQCDWQTKGDHNGLLYGLSTNVLRTSKEAGLVRPENAPFYWPFLLHYPIDRRVHDLRRMGGKVQSFGFIGLLQFSRRRWERYWLRRCLWNYGWVWVLHVSIRWWSLRLSCKLAILHLTTVRKQILRAHSSWRVCKREQNITTSRFKCHRQGSSQFITPYRRL